ncbi:MAG: helix-turn-helix domain-containing protein [Bacteroidia bacterium]
MASNPMHLGQKIKKLRELSNLTQEFVAAEIGVNQSSYSKIERGETDISFSRLEKIASILKVQPEEIIGFNAKFIFNVSNNKKASGVTINQVSINEKRLYEEYIQTLKLEISFLKSTIDKMLKSKK